MIFDISKMTWERKPEKFYEDSGQIRIITQPFTDLWQRTYYGFQNDNAPVLQFSTQEKYFSFSALRFPQN